ncbi:MAG: hypothetical protein AMJ65_01685 [Phycisphaerae bacterium SG8_4]|nr:MAG: hypothetical protein AMJ65_01685 [Phycisphaerae bacterium SG8_4]
MSGLATYTLNAQQGGWMVPCVRSLSLAAAICECLVGWIDLYKIQVMEVCLELPIYKGGVDTLTLQMRLLQDIEHGLMSVVEPALNTLYLTEVNNQTSKKLATGHGGATKAEMVEVSPFRNSTYSRPTKEALADAWAHSLAAKRQYNLTRSQLVPVFPKVIAPTISWDKLKKELGLD